MPLRHAPYFRYVGDFALFADDPAVLLDWRPRIERYLVGRRLRLHPRKTVILPCREPAQFLGVVLNDGHRRLPDDNVRRFRNRLRALRDRWRAGTIKIGDVDARVGAWIAHAEHADTWRLRHAIFRGGRSDPAGALETWTAPRNNNIGFRLGCTLCARASAPDTAAAPVLGDAWAPTGAAGQPACQQKSARGQQAFCCTAVRLFVARRVT